MAAILFIPPHPDDETLSYGAAIRRYVEDDHDVHVLLLCDGSGSAAQAETGLSTEDFVRARDDEFMRACRALGVPFENLWMPVSRAPGGTLTAEHAANLITSTVVAMTQFGYPMGSVWLKGYTDLPLNGRHVDHIMAARGARRVLADGVVANLRLYLEPWREAEFRAAHPTVKLITERATAVDRVRDAFDEYGDTDPKGRKYGIGHLSVGYWDDLRGDPKNLYHLP